MRTAFALLAVLVVVAPVGCMTYRDQLARSQREFEDDRHERALALLRDLEPDVVRLNASEQAQYAYLRGMTDYRIGHRADARHWLALARAYDESTPGILPADWKARTDDALAELDALVHESGYAALFARPRAGEDVGKKPDARKTKRRSPLSR